MADREAALAGRRELGPHRGDRVVEPEPALVDEPQEQEAQQALAGRVEAADRVGRPRPRPAGVGPPADEVDDRLAADGHADGGADLAPLGEVVDERPPHRLERRVAHSRDRHAHPADRTFGAARASRRFPARVRPVEGTDLHRGRLTGQAGSAKATSEPAVATTTRPPATEIDSGAPGVAADHNGAQLAAPQPAAAKADTVPPPADEPT